MSPLKKILRGLRKQIFPFKFIYSDNYWADLGEHVFPVVKYKLIYEALVRRGAKKENFLSPQLASEEDLLLVHTQKYLKKLRTGDLSLSEILTMELPYSPELLKFALLFVGGTILVAERALEDGLAVHIGGGFHHAFPDHGEGFCALNDVAVSLEKMKEKRKIERAMVVDCDLHQGNGTAFIFAKKDYAFTFSIHQMDNYPAHKPSSSVDVGLWTGDGDEKYLSKLSSNFPRLYQEFQPDLIYYLAGADPYEKDRLGGLKLTMEGLKERDRIVIEEARKLRIPVAILFAGGYASLVKDTVSVHLNTVKVAQSIQRKYS
ncbi:MAG: histone deacetylase [Candidatus Aminicenantes bacterium]|nr:histone deacetylase [Candidatus Aminicenantes bacterium]